MSDDDVIERVEEARMEAKISQTALARSCGLSQGHYSKVVSKAVPLRPKTRANLEKWLDGLGSEAKYSEKTPIIAEMTSLAGSIRRECDRLIALAERARS